MFNKIKVKDIFENWDKWMNKKMLMQYDLFIYYHDQKTEILAFNRKKRTIEISDGKSGIKTIPANAIDFVYY